MKLCRLLAHGVGSRGNASAMSCRHACENTCAGHARSQLQGLSGLGIWCVLQNVPQANAVGHSCRFARMEAAAPAEQCLASTTADGPEK